MWAMGMRKPVSPLGANRYLQAFYRIHHQQSELPIKHIETHNVIKAGARWKGVRSVVRLEGKPVSPKTVIIQVGEIVAGAVPVWD